MINKNIDHSEREVTPLSEVLANRFFADERREISDCYELAIQITETKKRLKQILVPDAEPILRFNRDQLYKQFRKYDYDIRYEVYGALSVAQRELIPYSLWMYGFSMNTTY